jgi:hypothetical protein
MVEHNTGCFFKSCIFGNSTRIQENKAENSTILHAILPFNNLCNIVTEVHFSFFVVDHGPLLTVYVCSIAAELLVNALGLDLALVDRTAYIERPEVFALMSHCIVSESPTYHKDEPCN